MAESKNRILKAVRQHLLEAVEHPGSDGPWITYDDPLKQFSEVLATVGGHAMCVDSIDQINADLQQHPVYASASVICSNVDGVGEPSLRIEDVEQPHGMSDVDFAIIRGEFAVAENGAVWIDGSSMHQRSVMFLCQHLAFVVPADQIVHNMSEAYRRLDLATPGFGTFVSGPSKTADIEQSLVIGAHGSRSLTVYLIRN